MRKCLILLLSCLSLVMPAQASQGEGSNINSAIEPYKSKTLLLGIPAFDYSYSWARDYLGMVNAVKEFWRIWADKKGVLIKFVDVEPSLGTTAIDANQVDLVLAVMHPRHPKGDYVFSLPYIAIAPTLYFRKEKTTHLSQLPTVLDISASGAADRLMIDHEVIDISEYSISDVLLSGAKPDAILSLSESELDYTLSQLIIHDQYQKYTAPLPKALFRVAGEKQHTALIKEINHDFRTIMKPVAKRLTDKFFLTDTLEFAISDLASHIPEEQSEYLLHNPIANIALDKGIEQPPYTVSEKWNYSGISIDFLTQLSQATGVELVAEHVDRFPSSIESLAKGETTIMPSLYRTEERERKVNYLARVDQGKSKMVVNKSIGLDSNEALQDLTNHTLAIVDNYAETEYLLRYFPRTEVISFPTVESALHAVDSGMADAYIGQATNITVWRSLRHYNNITEAKIDLPEEFDRMFDIYIVMSPKYPVLFDIFSNAVSSFDADFTSMIKEHWVHKITQRSAHEEHFHTIWEQQNQNKYLVTSFSVVIFTLLFLLGRSYFSNKKLQRHIINTEQKWVSESDKSQRQFLAKMSHEIRTPMNGVLGMSESLSFTALNNEQREFVSVLNREANNLMSFINELIDLSHLDQPEFEFEKSSMRLDNLVTACFEGLAPRAHNKGLDYRLTLSKEIEKQFYNADKVRVIQLINNLLSNAIKYTSSGFVEMNVSIIEKTEETHLVLIEVNDSGIGIEPDMQEQIFQPFSQSEEGTERVHDGGGIGLSICKLIAEKMNGKVTVSSIVGEGSLFSIQLPLIKYDKNTVFDTPPDFSHIRTLVVEDNLMNQKVLLQQLSRTGVEAELAENGAEALDIINTVGLNSFDLILSDCHMPVMDGFQFVERANKMRGTNTLPLLFAVTADSLAAAEHRCQAAGFDNVLLKPCSELKLLGILEECDNILLQSQTQHSNASTKYFPQESSLHPLPPSSVLADIVDLVEPAQEQEITVPELSEVEEELLALTQQEHDVLRDFDILQYSDKENYFSREEVLELSMGSIPVLTEILNAFVQSAQLDMDRVQDAYQNRQWKEVKDTIHRIKGSVSYLGAHEIAEHALHIERLAENKSVELDTHIPAFNFAMTLLVEEVKEWISQQTES
ncbi:transporter substrate-binding domain-containing protein [Vibrio hannami]|uniref:ATP-binding protein n=1 Tax=Vibrio hannami TaxID=2717094 RepID=UPI00240EE3A4|nr:transporter substrate-binding domain-containing protein [Vibrio hannami]MDG3087854.1 transporter substrate-binding domain-containing protein [Vibrio hannami]